MRTPRVVVAACRTAEAGGLYPDADWPLLRSAFAAAGASVERWSWDDPTAPWEWADVVVIRSTWDSVDRPDEYVAWVRETSRLVPVVNPADAVVWNLDKRHLVDLGDAGLPVVPTVWCPPGGPFQAPPHEFVVKPAISGGGRSTARYSAADADRATAHVAALHAEGRLVMVQPYIDAVDQPGELKMVYLGGRFSHALRVGPLLERGVGVVDAPWERPVSVQVAGPTDRQRSLGEAVVADVRRRFGDSIYGRVDVVGEEDPQLLELELVDPALSLWARPGAADDLVAAVLAAAGRH